MKELFAGKFTERRSRFHAHLYRITSEGDIQEILKSHRKNYRKANHHCWALRLLDGGTVITDHKNDGEVGQPGKVLLELLEKHDLDHHALVVSRIFGGIKLGVGGVSRAFREAGDDTILAWDLISDRES